MNRYWLFVSALCLFIIGESFGQDPLARGYELLDQKNYTQAAHYFAEYLQEQPGHRTASICFNRAIGLDGDRETALHNLVNLERVYPDFELGLNVAEALLWNQRYEDALAKYNLLLQQNAIDFTANLGLANTYAGLQDYARAYDQINETLLLDSLHAGARISAGYIYLAYANQLFLSGRVSKSLTVLERMENFDLPIDLRDKGQELKVRVLQQMGPQAGLSYVRFRDEGGITMEGFEARVGLTASRFVSPVITYQRSHNKIDQIGLQVQHSLLRLSNTFYLDQRNQILTSFGLFRIEYQGQPNANSLSEVIWVYDSRANFSSHVGIVRERFELVALNLPAIFQTHVFGTFNYVPDNVHGIYLHGRITGFSDGNQRRLLVTSLYRHVNLHAVDKVGIIATWMEFDRTSESYFSALTYRALEGYVEILQHRSANQRLWLQTIAAFGFQWVDDHPRPKIFRFQLDASYQFSQRLALSGMYGYSSASYSTISGYSVVRARLGFTYNLSGRL